MKKPTKKNTKKPFDYTQGGVYTSIIANWGANLGNMGQKVNDYTPDIPIGDLISGLTTGLNALIPEQQDEKYLRPLMQKVYNPYSNGIEGSQALFAMGGQISPEKAREILHDGTIYGKSISEKQRKFFGAISNKKADNGMNIVNVQGKKNKNFKATYEEPAINYNNEDLQALSNSPSLQQMNFYPKPVPVNPVPQQHSLTFEKVFNSASGAPEYSPVFGVGWSNTQIQDYQKNLPETYNDLPVLRGQAYEDLWKNPQQFTPSQGTKQDVMNNLYSQIQFANGGNLQGDNRMFTPLMTNQLMVEDNKYKMLSPQTLNLGGEYHPQGGTKVAYNGNVIEAEKNEPISINDNGDAVIWGNMKVIGSNQKFKEVAKGIAKQEMQNANLVNRANKLLESSNPDNAYSALAYNSGVMMNDAAKIKSEQVAAQKEALGNLQQAMLDYADHTGIDPKEMSKQFAKGGIIPMADSGKWIQGAVNPKHKGFCSPMTKSTCTPKRKAFAETMKKHHGFHENGGNIQDEGITLSPEDYKFLLSQGFKFD